MSAFGYGIGLLDIISAFPSVSAVSYTHLDVYKRQSYALLRYFDGPNDGLVNESAARWGQRFFCLSSESDGISHADVIDLMRHDKPDFDVREFYVQLVSDLKQKGL